MNRYDFNAIEANGRKYGRKNSASRLEQIIHNQSSMHLLSFPIRQDRDFT